MNIGILGAGSVGLGIAASLVNAGARVTIITRGDALRKLGTDGITITGVLGEHKISPKSFSVVDVSARDLALDLLIVTTKTYEVAPSLKSLLPAFGSKMPMLLLLQNGWGSAQEARAVVPEGTPVFTGIVMSGLERLSASEMKIHAHVDAVRVGSLFGDDNELLRAFFDTSRDAIMPFVGENAMEPVILGKLLYNICLNPLGAILGCTYGEALRSEPALEIMYNIAEEGIKILAAARHYTAFISGKQYVQEWLVGKLLPKVGAHRSSMLQDIEGGRRTEIDYLNGAIVKFGREEGIATPVNETISGLVRTAEGLPKK